MRAAERERAEEETNVTASNRGEVRRQLARCMVGVTMAVAAALGASSTTVPTGNHQDPLVPNTIRVSTCPSTATFVGNPSSLLLGTWTDSVNPVPASIGESDIKAEAERAAAHFGNLTPTSNDGAQ